MPNIHPVFVHFPIALLTVTFLFEVTALILRNQDLSRAAWWVQITGTLGLTVAVVTGLFAETTIAIPESAGDAFSTHEQTALASASVFAVLLLWRVAHRGTLPERYRVGFLILMLAGVALLWLTAWYGGELVFTHGVGVTR